jgi:hypothetical protein
MPLLNYTTKVDVYTTIGAIYIAEDGVSFVGSSFN